MSDDTLIARLEQLEARLRRAEDHLAIAALIAGYGPAVDSMRGHDVARMFVPDGTYELQGYHFTRDSMAGTVQTDLHLGYVAAGCAHVLSAPRITIDGDRALAINYSQVFLHEGDRWVIDRCSANRWDLERTGEGWKVRRRVNRLADGGPDAPALLAGQAPPPAA